MKELSDRDKQYIERCLDQSILCQNEDGQIFKIIFGDFLLKCLRECSTQFYLDLTKEYKNDPLSNEPLKTALKKFEEFYECKPVFNSDYLGKERPSIFEKLMFGRRFFMEALFHMKDSVQPKQQPKYYSFKNTNEVSGCSPIMFVVFIVAALWIILSL